MSRFWSREQNSSLLFEENHRYMVTGSSIMKYQSDFIRAIKLGKFVANVIKYLATCH